MRGVIRMIEANVYVDCDDLTKLILTKGKLVTDFILIVEDR